MGSRKLQTCFISAPIGVDTQPLREALAERGVESWDASAVLTGSSIPRTIEDVIADADFLCAVFPAGPVASNVYYELGVAVGKNRPRLLFVDPKADLPVTLREQPYARTTLDNASALRFQLDAFLKNAGKEARRRESEQREERVISDSAVIGDALLWLTEWERQPWPPREQDLVRLLAEVFETSGYVTSIAAGPSTQGVIRPDIAVWIDELQTTVGNPLLVEVVALNESVLSGVQQMQHMLSDSQSTLGLVVYWRLDTEEQPQEWAQPFVVTMGARELVEAILQGDFARELLARRNAVAHSAA